MSILKNKWFILGNILLLLAVIPITLYVIKQQTDLRSKAAPSTTLSLAPQTVDAAVGEELTFEITVDPGQNIVSIVEMNISVDSEKLEIVSLENNPTVFPVKLRGPTLGADGTATISMSTSNEISQAVQKPSKAATLKVKALATTTSPTVIKINQTSSQVFSLSTADGETENVLATAGSASVNISESGGIGSPNPSLSPSPSATPSGSVTQKPSCTALTTDKSSTGTAPYALVFTVTGNSSSSTIESVSFNFGDGVTQVATSSGGIGTNAVNVAIAHTYKNPGVYSASTILTDAKGATSDVGPCTKSITANAVAAAPTTAPPASSGGGQSGGGQTGGQNPTPTLPVTGILENTIAVGVIALIVIGAGLFFFVL